MIKDLLEKLELVCPSDPEMQLGDTYFAETEKDVFDGLDELIPGDALGIYLKHKEIDETQELTIEMLDEDKYKMYIEKDTEENSNDWEGKNVLDTNPIDKNQVIATLSSLLQDYKVISNKNESLAGYKTVAKIIQNKNGFNVAEEDEPMLNEDQPTLKTLLTKLAKYL